MRDGLVNALGTKGNEWHSRLWTRAAVFQEEAKIDGQTAAVGWLERHAGRLWLLFESPKGLRVGICLVKPRNHSTIRANQS